MKHMKAKLMATVMSLVLATAMLTSASFAWFTISTAPEISNISTTVAANKNLEIALVASTYIVDDDTTLKYTAPADSATSDAGSNTTWGNLVDLKDFFKAETGKTPAGAMADIELKPVEVKMDSNKVSVKYPVYALDGRIKELAATTLVHNGGNTGTMNKEKSTTTYADNGLFRFNDSATGSTYAFAVNFWMRSNVEGTVSLSAAEDRGDGNTETGLGSWIDCENKNIKVAFSVNGGSLIATTRAETAKSGNQYALTGEILTFGGTGYALNTPILVTMYVYLDGTTVTNADMAAAKNVALNVQFVHSAIVAADAMSVTESGTSGRGFAGSFDGTKS